VKDLTIARKITEDSTGLPGTLLLHRLLVSGASGDARKRKGGNMRRFIAVLAFGAALSIGTAYGQEGTVGGGRVEIGLFPVGGIFFGHPDNDENKPNFGNYALGTAVTVNVNRWIGFEGEIGGGIGIRQNMTFNGQTLNNQKTPHMLAYNGNLVVNVIGNDRAISPYVAAGVGGLTLFANSAVSNLGIVNDETYFTGNVGGGVKWFASRHVGLRGDARFVMVKNKDEAPFFNNEENRYGARVYAGLLLTY